MAGPNSATRKKMTNDKNNMEIVQVCATQAFFGSEELYLANSRISFTFGKAGTGLEPVIKFVLKISDGRANTIRFAIPSIEGISFLKSDPSKNISAAVSISLKLGASGYLREVIGAIGSKVDKEYSDHQCKGDGTPPQLSFILKPWIPKGDTYTLRDFEEETTFGTFQDFIKTCVSFASMAKRDVDPFPIGSKRNKAPQRPQRILFAYWSFTEWEAYLDEKGLALSKELNEDRFRYYVGKEDPHVAPAGIPDISRVSLASQGMARISPTKASEEKAELFRTLPPHPQRHQHLPESHQQQQPLILVKRTATVIAARQTLPAAHIKNNDPVAPTQAPRNSTKNEPVVAGKPMKVEEDKVAMIVPRKQIPPTHASAMKTLPFNGITNNGLISTSTKTEISKEPGNAHVHFQPAATACAASAKSNDSSSNTSLAPVRNVALLRTMQLLPTPVEDTATLAQSPPNASESETVSTALPLRDISNEEARKNNSAVAAAAPVSIKKHSIDAETASTSSTKANDCSLNTSATSAASPSAMQVLRTPAGEDTLLAEYSPDSSKCETIKITYKDMWRLVHNRWVNDVIVEFGIRHLLYDHHKEKTDKIHLMSTYFYSTFAKNSPDYENGDYFSPNDGEKRKALLDKNYVKVRKWTRKVNIFVKDFIVIPVNDGVHWHLIIVAYPKRALIKKEKPEGGAPTDPKEMCQVYVFDSLPNSKDPKRCCAIMSDYLRLEFEDKKVENSDLRFSKEHVCPIPVSNLPMQKNKIDCGVYLIAYLDSLLTNISTIGQNDILDVNKWQPKMSDSYFTSYREKLVKRIQNITDKGDWNAYVDDDISRFPRSS